MKRKRKWGWNKPYVSIYSNLATAFSKVQKTIAYSFHYESISKDIVAKCKENKC